MDKAVIELAIKYCEGRKHVRPADVVAIIDRESGGVGIFHPSEHLFKTNVRAAELLTGLNEDQIIRAATIVSGLSKGEVSKFRCEPAYFKWAQGLSFKPHERFMLGCSFGVGQKMMRWLVTGRPQSEWITIIQQFMGSLPTQVMYTAGDLDQLMARYPNDRQTAYTAYNAGHDRKANYWKAAYVGYGADVVKRHERFRQMLEHDYHIT